MIVKAFELRDRATFIPMVAIKTMPSNEEERYLLARAGYGRMQEDQSKYIIMGDLNAAKFEYDPYFWDNRTRQTAHKWLIENFDSMKSGDVIDVEYILGESVSPKVSERETIPI
nr:hypothetical protein 33 [Candidatus Omnitrophota bacterium]